MNSTSPMNIARWWVASGMATATCWALLSSFAASRAASLSYHQIALKRASMRLYIRCVYGCLTRKLEEEIAHHPPPVVLQQRLALAFEKHSGGKGAVSMKSCHV